MSETNVKNIRGPITGVYDFYIEQSNASNQADFPAFTEAFSVDQDQQVKRKIDKPEKKESAKPLSVYAVF